jgi:hypothetical protein
MWPSIHSQVQQGATHVLLPQSHAAFLRSLWVIIPAYNATGGAQGKTRAGKKCQENEEEYIGQVKDYHLDPDCMRLNPSVSLKEY